MKRFRIHKEGRLILMCVVLLFFLLNIPIYLYFPGWTFGIVLGVSAVFLVWATYFFRNPFREVEVDDPTFVVAPADGTVVVVEPVDVPYFQQDPNDKFGGKRMQVSIFMSIFSVHANWYPFSGDCIVSEHQDGNHAVAWLPKSSTENERSTIVMRSQGGTDVLVRQIAGALARRIVTYAKAGKPGKLNEHLGFIKFGSRVDLFLPLDAEIFVEIGEKTTGNETIIARLNE